MISVVKPIISPAYLAIFEVRNLPSNEHLRTLAQVFCGDFAQSPEQARCCATRCAPAAPRRALSFPRLAGWRFLMFVTVIPLGMERVFRVCAEIAPPKMTLFYARAPLSIPRKTI